MNDENLKKRIKRTLEIAESRGYNLTKQKLADQILGGKISKEQLDLIIKTMKNIVFDDVFIATTDNCFFKKCKYRKEKNDKINKAFLKIAKEFTFDYLKICPWVYCVMLTGSIASEGVCEDDDIDLDLVVHDNTKYISYLIAILLSLKYSIKYKKLFKNKYLGFISKVICISVIWENNQVMHFTRRDEQIAYELLNVIILYNLDYFKNILSNNLWLKNYFPQIFEENRYINYGRDNKILLKSNKKWPWIFEYLAYAFMFFLYKIIRFSRTNNPVLKNRMISVEKSKYPYGIFDIPD